ncbi:MAG: hypothetical protein ACOYYS_23230 [Chloroflexota bacterium]
MTEILTPHTTHIFSELHPCFNLCTARQDFSLSAFFQAICSENCVTPAEWFDAHFAIFPSQNESAKVIFRRNAFVKVIYRKRKGPRQAHFFTKKAVRKAGEKAECHMGLKMPPIYGTVGEPIQQAN